MQDRGPNQLFPPSVDHHNNVHQSAQIMTFLTIQFSPYSCPFLSIRPEYSPQNSAYNRQGVEQEIADTRPRGNLIFALKSLLVLLLIIQSLFCISLCLYCTCIIEVHTVHFVGNYLGVLTEAMIEGLL